MLGAWPCFAAGKGNGRNSEFSCCCCLAWLGAVAVVVLPCCRKSFSLSTEQGKLGGGVVVARVLLQTSLALSDRRRQ